MWWITLENFLLKVLDISAQAAIIFCVLLLVRSVFSLCKIPKKYACFLWMILFVRLLIPVQPESPVGLWIKYSGQPFPVENMSNHPYSAVPVQEGVPAPEDAYDTGNADGSEEIRVFSAGAVSDTSDVRAFLSKDISLFMGVIWGIGCLGFLLYGGISVLLLRKKLLCSIKGEDDCYLADGIPTAFVMGLFPPRIYLPSEFAGENTVYVVLHERMHVRRKDYLVKMAAYLIACFYWFHLFVWAALVFLSRDIELACDEAVLSELGEGGRQDYADTLLRFSAGKHYFMRVPLAFGEGNTGGRIRHIIRYKKPAAIAGIIAVILIIVLTVSLLTGRPAAEGGGSDNGPAGPENHSVIAGGKISLPDISNITDQEGGQSLMYYPVELPSDHEVAISSKTIVIIDGEEYDVAELCDSVNGVMPEVREFDKYIVVKGHISPDNSYYGFFNTENRQWERGFIGAHLTWDENWETLENPLESVIYADGGDSQGVIRDWKTNMIAVFDLEKEYIRGLRRVGDDITITIASIESDNKERKLSFDFKDSYYTLFHW